MPELGGKYEVLEKIREGGMGAIYKVRHRLLDEVRVIKVMRPSLEADDELRAVDRFVREARIAIKLRHPNIAQLYDFSSDRSGNAIIVMEFIDGLNLDDVLKHTGPPSMGLAIEIATQSLEALGALHASGFVHRDVSPDNLMLTLDLRGRPLVKLIDLGIAKLVHSEDGDGVTKTGTFLGKYRYAPPEMFQDASGAGIDNRSDLYSFGIVLYKLLTDAHPITGTDISSVIAGHLFREPVSFSQSDPEARVPPEIQDVVLKALSKQPEDRFQSAEEMVAALESVQQELALRPGPGEVERLMALHERLRDEAAAKVGTGTQAGIDDLFPAGSTQVPDEDGDATVLLPADEEAGDTGGVSDSRTHGDDTTLLMEPEETGSSKSAATRPLGAGPQSTQAKNGLAPLMAVGAVVGLLAVVLVVVLSTRGRGAAEPDAASAVSDQGAESADQALPLLTADAIELADPVDALLDEAEAAAAAADMELAASKLSEVDELLAAQQEQGAPPPPVGQATRVALLRTEVREAEVDDLGAVLGRAVANGDAGAISAALRQITPELEQLFVEDAERARSLEAARTAVATINRFEQALNSDEPQRALAMAFELGRSHPDVARSINARERAARAVEERVEALVREGNFAEARTLTEALLRHWPDRPRLRERAQRLARMSTASQNARGIFREAELTIEAGEPHVGLQMLEGRQVPPPFKDRVEQLRSRLREELRRLDQEVPTFAPLEPRKDVDFDRGSPAVVRVQVTDDYEVVSVQARARNAKGDTTIISAVALGDDVYRISVPADFHADQPFNLWALAVDHLGNEGRLGTANQPMEIRRKRRFRRGRG